MLDERDGPVPPASCRAPSTAGRRWQRILVLLAGPARELPVRDRRLLGPVHAGHSRRSSRWSATSRRIRSPRMPDLRPRDEILRVGGQATPTRQAAVLAMLEGVDRRRARSPVEVRGSDGREREAHAPRAGQRAARADRARHAAAPASASISGTRRMPVVVGELTPDVPAAARGPADRRSRSSRSTASRSTTSSKFVNLITRAAGTGDRRSPCCAAAERLSVELVPKRSSRKAAPSARSALGADAQRRGRHSRSHADRRALRPARRARARRAQDLGHDARSRCASCAHDHRRRLDQEHLRARSTSRSTPG